MNDDIGEYKDMDEVERTKEALGILRAVASTQDAPEPRGVSNVIPLGNITRLDLPTDRILEEAKGHCADGVIVLGFDDDGTPYFASSIADGGTVVWLLELAKFELFAIATGVVED